MGPADGNGTSALRTVLAGWGGAELLPSKNWLSIWGHETPPHTHLKVDASRGDEEEVHRTKEISGSLMSPGSLPGRGKARVFICLLGPSKRWFIVQASRKKRMIK